MASESKPADSPPFIVAPAPWKCKCEAYWFMFWGAAELPGHAYAPLEASAPSFSDPSKTGKFLGGLGSIQIVRYTETPVGPYDEMVIIPGHFDLGANKKNWRITRIYVSQKETTWNGRKNWNIPKHLAKFSFTHPPESPKSVKIEVFPQDSASKEPFFTATIKPVRFVPSFPFSTKTLAYVGMDAHLVQPPLTASSEPGRDELIGTEEWQKMMPYAYGKGKLAWWDLKQAKRSGPAEGEVEGDALIGEGKLENFWPGSKRWAMGLWLEDGVLDFPEPEPFKPEY